MPTFSGDTGSVGRDVPKGIASRFVRTYTTMSGIDITAMFDDRTMFTVSGVSCSVTREKTPVYTFSSALPRSISRGKRGIAGSIVATLFDRDAFLDMMLDPRKWYYAHRDVTDRALQPFKNLGSFLRSIFRKTWNKKLQWGVC